MKKENDKFVILWYSKCRPRPFLQASGLPACDRPDAFWCVHCVVTILGFYQSVYIEFGARAARATAPAVLCLGRARVPQILKSIIKLRLKCHN